MPPHKEEKSGNVTVVASGNANVPGLASRPFLWYTAGKGGIRLRLSTVVKRTLLTLGAPLRHLQGHPAPQVEHIPIYIQGLPAAFSGYRIAVVADLHLPHSLSSPQQVADDVQDAAPDCIFIAGDLANRYAHFDKDGIDAFLAALTAIAPCVAVIGNHERGVYRENYRAAMQKAGIPLMENRFETLERGGQTLPVYGVGYPPKTVTATDVPALLLLHHPEDAAAFKSAGFSLAVCGHAHGGQIGLGKRGLYAPGQGFFPQYVSGLYTVGDMALVVSRGLGDSSLSLRLHNPPHLPVLTLYGK